MAGARCRDGAIIVAAARECVGARFRAQGRDPGIGLDCIGVAAWAYRAVGAELVLPEGYLARGRREGQAAAAIEGNGFVRVAAEEAGAGDLVLLAAGVAQAHLAVLTGGGFVHADARLRRVVETPGRPGWTVIGAWRFRRLEAADSSLSRGERVAQP